MRWPIGIAVFFGVVFIVNGIFIYVALQSYEEPVPSYANNQDR
jgi:nitrogen fixation protein FixH